jgi:hypothetical protein
VTFISAPIASNTFLWTPATVVVLIVYIGGLELDVKCLWLDNEQLLNGLICGRRLTTHGQRGELSASYVKKRWPDITDIFGD